jgi:hypothetical protein
MQIPEEQNRTTQERTYLVGKEDNYGPGLQYRVGISGLGMVLHLSIVKNLQCEEGDSLS